MAMALSSSSSSLSFVCVLVFVCIHHCLVDPVAALRFLKIHSPVPVPVPSPSPSPSPTFFSPASSPAPRSSSQTSYLSSGASPAPRSSSRTSIPPHLSSGASPAPRSSSRTSDLHSHRRAKTLGLILVSFAGALQAFVIVYLFIKRRQMLKYVRTRELNETPQTWNEAL